MPYLHGETENQQPLQRIWAGVIATDAVDKQDRVSVVIPSLDRKLRWEDLRWPTRSDAQIGPQRGDECVIIIDDNSEMWIANWWPENPVEQAAGGGGTVYTSTWRWTTTTTSAAAREVGV